jgi:TolB-like protein/DNA-binding winged helix-turn-helix (wHTH) protein/tetratricopeptide (TPR) repeat protein
MPEFSSSIRSVRFGVFEVDLRAGEVRKKGVRVRLQGQPYMLLVTLLKQQGEVVTREELRRALWPEDTFVDFDHSLGTAVNKLREMLGDSASNPRFVETLHRKGYRFIAPVTAFGGSEDTPVVHEDAVTEPQPAPADLPAPVDQDQAQLPGRGTAKRSWLRHWKMSGFALVLLSAAVLALIFLSSHPSSNIRSLAVLPLENLSGEPSQDYFSDGMTDELTTELGQISELRVISRTSAMTYKGAHRPLPKIGQELNVDAVVEGTVLRSGNQVRITVQLIRATTDKQLWGKSYNVELRDILTVQKEVARSIVQEIRIELTPHEQAVLENAKRVNPEAYETYLKGGFFWNKRTADGLKKAIENFNDAIAKDPNYAPAYVGLADAYALAGDWQYGVLAPREAYPKAQAAATEAIALDNSLGEAHISLAWCLDGFKWDWEAAGKEFKQGIELSPGYATGHHWYGWHLAALGRHDEAIAELERAESLDPLSLVIGTDLAEELLIARRYDEAIQQSRKTMAMDPFFALTHFVLGETYGQKMMYNEAIAELQRAIELSPGSTAFTATLGYVYAVSGARDKAVKILNNLKIVSNDRFSNAAVIALVYVGLDEKDQAMAWLEKAYSERFNPQILMRPCFDPIRSDPRFQDLLRHIGLNL